jgi:hypothetical protein
MYAYQISGYLVSCRRLRPLPATTAATYLQTTRASANINRKTLGTRTKLRKGCLGGLLRCGLEPDVVKIEI